jgi:hypothetical protein
MPKKIVFFNYYHNGDIHVSRGFVRQIMNKVQQIDPTIQFAYGHRNSSALLSDIPNLQFDPTALSIVKNDHANLIVIGDVIYINTWYAQQNFKYMNKYGISIDALYGALDDSCQSIWGFSLDSISTDPSVFFPSIDYDKFQIDQAKKWLNGHPGKKVFVSNGAVLSDQAHNFSLTSIIDRISRKHTDKIFILSNKDGHPGSANIIHSSDIINKNGNDLNENSFISTYCDVIIGKASGSFTFAMTQENLFQRAVKFLALCNLTPVPPNKFWVNELLRDKIHYNAQIIVDNESDHNKIIDLIDINL